MTQYTLYSILLLLPYFSFGQTGNKDTIYTKVDQMPEFQGGDAAMMKFIQKNVRYPELERENDIQGLVQVGFIVDEDGNVTDIRILKGVSKGFDQEALRVVKLYPKFKPGKEKGQAVRVALTEGINFWLQEGSDDNLTHSQHIIIDQKAKTETDEINKLVPLGDLYQKVLSACKRDYGEIEGIKGGILAKDLSERQKEQMKAQDIRHKTNLKTAMGADLYAKYVAALGAQGNKDNAK